MSVTVQVRRSPNALLANPVGGSSVFGKDNTSEALEFFVVTKLDQPTQQFATQPLSLELVGDENGKQPHFLHGLCYTLP